jgi:malate synthase
MQNIMIAESINPSFSEILTEDALTFVAKLARRYEPVRRELIAARQQREMEFKTGKRPDFLPETADIRQAEWQISPIPHDLIDRRVEITGPAGDRKMVINALNSGAPTYMADLEDSLSPAWPNVINSQINLRDAVRGTLTFTNPNGKVYKLADKTATLIVRPRGWHLVEKHILIDGEPVSASIFDFALYFYHNAVAALEKGTGPYFYLPKLESHREARLWNDVFLMAQKLLGLPVGTIKVTVLIETLLAAFEMDEILYELKNHIVGLNCGRWDYIFSIIKKMRYDPAMILPDRSQVTMTAPLMRDYTLLTIKTCHRRGAYAIGGMAAQIPVHGDDLANQAAFNKVREDKIREAGNGHDGTWVAHPGLVPVALEAFDSVMTGPNQLSVSRDDVQITAENLLAVPAGEITENGLRTNIRVGIQYIAAWLGGSGAVPLNNLMEDAATAEISRAQIWQWIRHPRGVLGDGRKVTFALFAAMRDEELAKLKADNPDGEQLTRIDQAAHLITGLVADDNFEPFLTLKAYEYI